ncbi:EAL domain-containing protein [Corynebacterium callunae]|uniref:bifunctional diguanylate cyclase/phosphodiesterase n=1 Tax=Corynebacterium callunae TaxID=1721 RepID=UPI00398264E0
MYIKDKRPSSLSGTLKINRELSMENRGLRNLFFALMYVFSLVVSMSLVYFDSAIAVSWSTVGMVVLWSLYTRTPWEYVFLNAFVFVTTSLYMGVIVDSPVATALFIGLSQLVVGLTVCPLMRVLEKIPSRQTRGIGVRLSSPTSEIVNPRFVYRLLIASLVMLPVADALALFAVSYEGFEPTLTVYFALILRDLSSIITIAGAGAVIITASLRGIGATAVREFIMVVAVTGLVLGLIFGPGKNLPIIYFSILPLYWSATRLPVALASFHAVITVLTASVLAFMLGTGPFIVSDSMVTQASAVEVYIITCILLSLVVSTTVQRHTLLVTELETLIETIPDALLTIDREGQLVPLNLAAQDVMLRNSDGTYRTRLLREVDGGLLNEHSRPSGQALRGKHVRGKMVEFADIPADQDPQYFSVSASPLYFLGETVPDHALLLYHDSTDKYQAIRELRRARDDANYLFEYAPQGIAVLDEEGIILQANSALGELLEAPVEELVGCEIEKYIAGNDLSLDIGSAINEPGARVHTDRCFNTQDGQSKSLALSFRTKFSSESDSHEVLMNAVDITERQRLHDLVSHLADHDALTGLVNRRRLETEFKKILEQDVAGRNDGAVLLIDLDNFKMANDELGHHVGDELLVEFAQLLKVSVRDSDIVGRFGGDEFVIILPNADQNAAISVGKRIIEGVNQRYSDQPNALKNVTASIGISMFSEARAQGVDPLRLADRLLYDAKNSGRNRFAVLSAKKLEAETDKPEISTAFVKEVLESEAFDLELQPIAECSTGEVTLAEGLLRVKTAGGLVPTGDFVAAVEKAGLGPVLDKRVMKKGIKLLPMLQEAKPGFRLTLNMSAQSIGSEEVFHTIVSELEKYQIKPESLIIEVTESAPITDLDLACEFLHQLHDHGVDFAMDDFGTGADPYRNLKCLDFDILKFAGEIVEGVIAKKEDLNIVQELVGVAKKRQMSTVAEYVSNPQIFDLAKEIGITYAQGYHIGVSLPPGEFIDTHLKVT